MRVAWKLTDFFFGEKMGKFMMKKTNRISRSGGRFILGCDHTAATYILGHQLKVGKYLLTFIIELVAIVSIQFLQFNQMILILD